MVDLKQILNDLNEYKNTSNKEERAECGFYVRGDIIYNQLLVHIIMDNFTLDLTIDENGHNIGLVLQVKKYLSPIHGRGVVYYFPDNTKKHIEDYYAEHNQEIPKEYQDYENQQAMNKFYRENWEIGKFIKEDDNVIDIHIGNGVYYVYEMYIGENYLIPKLYDDGTDGIIEDILQYDLNGEDYPYAIEVVKLLKKYDEK